MIQYYRIKSLCSKFHMTRTDIITSSLCTFTHISLFPPPPTPLETTLLLSAYSLRPYISEIMQYVFFCIWLISLSTMSSLHNVFYACYIGATYQGKFKTSSELFILMWSTSKTMRSPLTKWQPSGWMCMKPNGWGHSEAVVWAQGNP